ncbi:hypothetical protein [Curtobacterium sp. VKM Ac-2884]|uniref:hypothetical protein n=1 Tax=Curtobacterium sp. VKM Ac-2884 TaxID=2783818 RepID=UPI00188C67CB|nr:hypothetical protein [Curtobacterium sp. VKM Ac-2884]MBF4603781.1 hypothetical protein [Curtobacterium sp. VKM Ac-2884]
MTDVTPAQQQALQTEIARASADGWTVTSVTGNQAILQRKKRIGWFWNLVLTVVTGGLWLIVVIIRLVNRKTQTQIITVDAGGLVTRR